jgi:thiazole synthase ThiGH ThiG subunit
MERQANHTRIGGPATASVALVVLLGAVLLLPAIAAAAEPVGRVVAASGAVTAKRGDASNRSLARGTRSMLAIAFVPIAAPASSCGSPTGA